MCTSLAISTMRYIISKILLFANDVYQFINIVLKKNNLVISIIIYVKILMLIVMKLDILNIILFRPKQHNNT